MAALVRGRRFLYPIIVQPTARSPRSSPQRWRQYSQAAATVLTSDAQTASQSHSNVASAIPTLSPWFAARSLSSGQLTAPQLSRAAAQAVRMCSPREALYIVNSLHYSTFPNLQKSYLWPPKRDQSFGHDKVPLKPIDFGRPVSPRLAAHSFLHLLVRQGLSDKAAQYAKLMMKQGIRIHGNTTGAIVEALCKNGRSLIDQCKPRIPLTAKIHDIPAHLSHSGIGAAHSILSCARQFGQQRSERMYENLIYACLMQGEILVASLLFVVLVKDWQAYKARKEALEISAANSSDAERDRVEREIGNSGDAVLKLSRSKHAITPFAAVGNSSHRLIKPPYPQLQLLTAITSEITNAYNQEPDDPGGEHIQEPLQALANLVSLMDSGQMHFGQVSSVIALLYKCPRTSHTIHVYQDRKPVTVNAYTYFHDFLARTIAALKCPPENLLLDMRSCDALLHYSLRHRLSPHMGSIVLHHICSRRKPAVSTVNILLRSGTLLRRMDITEAALGVLRDTSISGKELVRRRAARQRCLEPEPEGVDFKADRTFKRGLKRLKNQRFKLPKPLSRLDVRLSPDVYTLTAYVSHLTATGKIESVIKLVRRLFPDLSQVYDPTMDEVVPADQQRARDELREAAIRKAVHLGPYFFAALINALTKGGRTGLVEQVWLLAQQAERASWNPEFAPEVEPWLLSVHAYTAMIQCYATEGRRPIVTEGERLWSKAWVRGWARNIYQEGNIQPSMRLRREAGSKMAAIVFRTMMSGGHQVVSSLFAARKAAERIPQIQAMAPVPDARFFNAILALIKPETGRTSKWRRNTSSYRQTFRWSLRTFARKRTMSRHWTPLLLEVGKAMVEAQFTVPLAFRHLFVGRLPEATRDFGNVPVVNPVPFSFPRHLEKPFGPLRLPTTKTRGLPTRRRHRVGCVSRWMGRVSASRGT